MSLSACLLHCNPPAHLQGLSDWSFHPPCSNGWLLTFILCIVLRFTYRCNSISYTSDRFLDLLPLLSELSRILLKINSQTLDSLDGIKKSLPLPDSSSVTSFILGMEMPRLKMPGCVCCVLWMPLCTVLTRWLEQGRLPSEFLVVLGTVFWNIIQKS